MVLNKAEVEESLMGRVKETFLIQDTEQDAYITNLIGNAYDEFCIITGALVVKPLYLMVIEGVVNKRYVRRGSDGLASENSDGYSVSYKDMKSDFAEYYGLLSVEYVVRTGSERMPSVRWH